MKRGIIIEVKKHYAIVLNNSGIMEKISYKKDMSVGQKIFYFENDIIKSNSKHNMHNMFIKTFGTMAALFLIVFTFFQTIVHDNAYAVVSLDINPSIQIEVNSNKKIVNVEGINKDGKNIDFKDIKNKNINEGIEKIKQILVEKKYLDNNKDVLVAFAFVDNVDDKDNSQYEETVTEAIKSTFKTENLTYVKGNKEAVDEAKTKGISLGRYEASIKVNEEIKKNIESIPVKEITANIKDKENVIYWEAKEEKGESGDTLEKDKENKPTSERPAVEKPAEKQNEKTVEKPITKIPEENIDPKQDKESSDGDKDIKEKDNGILEVLPEKPQLPKESEEVPDESEKLPKEPEDNIIINPDEGTIKNKETSGKIEDKEEVKENVKSISNEKENEINK